MRNYLLEDCREEPGPFRVVFLHPQEQMLQTDCAFVNLGLLLQNKQYSWRLRATFVLRTENGLWRICHIHAILSK